MITIINERNGHKTKFKNYKKLYSYIEYHQRSKRRNKPISDWVFARHSYHRAVSFYDFICRQKEKTRETPGWDNQKFEVLEISYDKSVRPTIIPITLNADIEPHLENWCKKYCQFHRFKLVEVEEDDDILRVKKEPADLANIYNLWWRG